jgi:hypothetical protein
MGQLGTWRKVTFGFCVLVSLMTSNALFCNAGVDESILAVDRFARLVTLLAGYSFMRTSQRK